MRGRRVFPFLFAFCLILVTAVSNGYQPPPLIPEGLRNIILSEISGEIAWWHTVMISRYDRIQASEGWHKAALYVKGEIEKYGINDAKIEGWYSDGDTYYGTFRTPVGWRASSGELFMVSPERMKLASYEELPTVLVKHSVDTDLTAEVVDVGAGLTPADYQGKDVSGKIVLATGYSGDVHREAVIKRGAVGVLNYMSSEVRRDYPYLVQYTALWPRLSEKGKLGFGFNLSRQQADMIGRFLKEGKKVELKVKVVGEIYPSKIEVMSATIPGTKYPDEEVLLMAHLDHYQPGANDNASGSAGLLEVARTLRRLIDKGKIKPPARTIRFLWVSEIYGTIAYLVNHPEVAKRTIAGINLDMIGEDLEKTSSYFYVTRTPDSNPSFLNALMESLVEEVARLNITTPRGSRAPWNYRIFPYFGGSDHYIFTEGSFRVPAVMFGHPDPYHHTIQDDVDKVDQTELKRVILLSTLASYFIAQAEAADGMRLATDVFSREGFQASEEVNLWLAELDKASSPDELYPAYYQAVNVCRHSFLRARKAVSSVAVFSSDGELKGYLGDLKEKLKSDEVFYHRLIEKRFSSGCYRLGVAKRRRELSFEEKRAAGMIPIRKPGFIGPLDEDYLKDKLGEEAGKLPLRGNLVYEAINFIDGKRDLLEIRDALSAEYRPVPLSSVERFFKVLERAELISLTGVN
jgi:aminopeptidase YwaD